MSSIDENDPRVAKRIVRKAAAHEQVSVRGAANHQRDCRCTDPVFEAVSRFLKPEHRWTFEAGRWRRSSFYFSPGFVDQVARDI